MLHGPCDGRIRLVPHSPPPALRSCYSTPPPRSFAPVNESPIASTLSAVSGAKHGVMPPAPCPRDREGSNSATRCPIRPLPGETTPRIRMTVGVRLQPHPPVKAFETRACFGTETRVRLKPHPVPRRSRTKQRAAQHVPAAQDFMLIRLLRPATGARKPPPPSIKARHRPHGRRSNSWWNAEDLRPRVHPSRYANCAIAKPDTVPTTLSLVSAGHGRDRRPGTRLVPGLSADGR